MAAAGADWKMIGAIAASVFIQMTKGSASALEGRETTGEELYHYGVKGMKWGVRRTAEEFGNRVWGKKHDEYKNAHERKSVRSMSTSELQEKTKRLQAENQYRAAKSANSKRQRAVKSFIKTASLVTASVAAYKVYDKYVGEIMGRVRRYTIPKLPAGRGEF